MLAILVEFLQIGLMAAITYGVILSFGLDAISAELLKLFKLQLLSVVYFVAVSHYVRLLPGIRQNSTDWSWPTAYYSRIKSRMAVRSLSLEIVDVGEGALVGDVVLIEIVHREVLLQFFNFVVLNRI
jgi:hypothetical protein